MQIEIHGCYSFNQPFEEGDVEWRVILVRDEFGHPVEKIGVFETKAVIA